MHRRSLLAGAAAVAGAHAGCQAPGTDASDPPDRLANPSFEADDRGWRTYEYDVTADGPGVVAGGISVVWETEVTRHLDDVRLA